MITKRWYGVAVLFMALTSTSSSVLAKPNNFIGINAHQPAKDIIDGLKDLGVSWVRIDFNWFQVQPQKSSKIDFSHFDNLVNAALARGLKVFPTIGYAPNWNAEADTDGQANNNVPKAGEYEKICKAAAAHFKGRITHWGLWNEANLSFFDGSMQQWIDRVVIEGVRGIKAGCPACKVLGPELASVGHDYDVWFEAAVNALKKAGLMYDAITWHIYSNFPVIDPQLLLCGKDQFVNELDKHRVCYLGPLKIYEGPLSVREVMIRTSIEHLPVWITETGRTAPIGDAKRIAEQTTYFRRVMEEQLKRPWWTHTFFYEIVDDNNIADKWGMAVRTGKNPQFPGSYQFKPTWKLLKKVLAKASAFGGTGTDCDDGLDNDGDKKVDFPADKECSSASDPRETVGGAPVDSGMPTPDGGAPTLDKGVVPAKDSSVAPRDQDVRPQDEVGVSGDYGQTDMSHPRVDASPTSPKTSDGGTCRVSSSALPSNQLFFFVALFLGAILLRRRF
ncbi:MAG: cellulase family glycosylhydrolase [Deltaproteobacteria bacterium]|nr:cellulase family glycosylhydrolase [Deltaproteobacteria bacterium]